MGRESLRKGTQNPEKHLKSPESPMLPQEKAKNLKKL